MINCIECGNSISDKSEICVHCGCPTKLSKISDINIDEKILYDYLSNGDYVLGIKYIKDTLDIDLKDARNYVEQYKDNHPELKSSKVQPQNIPKCPKCGNTEFTPLRKKFSLLTGFATNKTELICNKCGARVK